MRTRLLAGAGAAIDLLAQVANVVAALVLMGMTGLIVLEIVLRNVFLTSTHLAEEFVGYGLSAVVFLALASALSEGSLIRVDLVVERLPSRARRIAEILIVLASLSAMLFLLRFVAATLERYWRTGAVSWTMAEVPLWIPQAVVLSGIVLFCLQLLAYLVRLLAGGQLVRTRQRVE
jgi:TRAP-type C4-dicarboxylate transport system permease small subunit